MGGALRILNVEDSEDDGRLLLMSIERAGYKATYRRVDTLDAMNSALEEPWDIVISDHAMPRFTASGALAALKARGLDIPVIIVSGTIEPVAAVAAMREGASDYMMKGDLTRLIPAIERELREAGNRREGRRAEEEKQSIQAQFLQSQKMEAIGRLAGGVAHDFNNLLTAISGYCHFLLGSLPEGDPNREDVEEIRKAGERAAALTRQLLAFSRQQMLQPKVVDLNAIVQDIEKMLRRVIGEDRELVATCKEGVGRIKVDPGQIEQVILNLVVNARDAMPRGGKITIETGNIELSEEYVRSHPEVQPGPHVMLAVSDTGCGMDAKTLARIFEPFFTTKEQGKGTGLGLSTVYGIVKQSGGSIFVYSEPGQGSVFKVYLPRVMDQAERKETDQAAPRAAGGDETILLVEDDEMVYKFVLRLLLAQGYTVLATRRPMDALRLSAEHKGRIHLLLTDIVMPETSGEVLAERLLRERSDTRVIFMSGYTEEGVVRGNILRPGAAFIQKPVDALDLIRKVREMLDEPAAEERSQ